MAMPRNANSDRDASSRDTVYRKPAAAATQAPAKSKGPANAGPVKTAGAPAKATPKTAPTPTARPNASTSGTSGAVQSAKGYTPQTDAQYNSYSTSGATQSAAKRPAPEAPTRTGYPADYSTRKSVSNDTARYNSAKANAPKAAPTIFNSNSAMPGEASMNDFGNKALNYLNNLKMPGEDAMNAAGSKIKKKIFG